jgi:hypothetical protein
VDVTRLSFRQADQARTDFAVIEDELEAAHARLASDADAEGDRAHGPARHDRRGGLVIAWFELLSRHCF